MPSNELRSRLASLGGFLICRKEGILHGIPRQKWPQSIQDRHRVHKGFQNS